MSNLNRRSYHNEAAMKRWRSFYRRFQQPSRPWRTPGCIP